MEPASAAAPRKTVLGWCCSCCAVRGLAVLHRRFEAMLHVMQTGMPDTQIIIQAIYPRGADFASNSFQWPNHFTYPIDLLNALYQASHARTCAGMRLSAYDLLSSVTSTTPAQSAAEATLPGHAEVSGLHHC